MLPYFLDQNVRVLLISAPLSRVLYSRVCSIWGVKSIKSVYSINFSSSRVACSIQGHVLIKEIRYLCVAKPPSLKFFVTFL